MSDPSTKTDAEAAPDTMFGECDLMKAPDVALVNTAVLRWGLTHRRALELPIRIKAGYEVAKNLSTNQRLRAEARLETLELAMMAQQQADEHLEIKNARLDAGKPTEGMDIRIGKTIEIIDRRELEARRKLEADDDDSG